jgi:hypothetical protein
MDPGMYSKCFRKPMREEAFSDVYFGNFTLAMEAESSAEVAGWNLGRLLS